MIEEHDKRSPELKKQEEDRIKEALKDMPVYDPLDRLRKTLDPFSEKE